MSTLDCLIDYVSNWRNSNGITYSGNLETDDYIKFAQDLQNEIANNVSFSMDSSQTLILYTGNNSDGVALYNDIGVFCNTNSDFYYISNTEAGLLWNA